MTFTYLMRIWPIFYFFSLITTPRSYIAFAEATHRLHGFTMFTSPARAIVSIYITPISLRFKRIGIFRRPFQLNTGDFARLKSFENSLLLADNADYLFTAGLDFAAAENSIHFNIFVFIVIDHFCRLSWNRHADNVTSASHASHFFASLLAWFHDILRH